MINICLKNASISKQNSQRLTKPLSLWFTFLWYTCRYVTNFGTMGYKRLPFSMLPTYLIVNLFVHPIFEISLPNSETNLTHLDAPRLAWHERCIDINMRLLVCVHTFNWL